MRVHVCVGVGVRGCVRVCEGVCGCECVGGWVRERERERERERWNILIHNQQKLIIFYLVAVKHYINYGPVTNNKNINIDGSK